MLWYSVFMSLCVYQLHGSAERLRTQPYANDPVAMMEFYMKKAAREDLRKPPKQSKDEMPPPASLQTSPCKLKH